MRKTLAVLGAAVLVAGFTSIASPASAAQGDILINEVAAELDPASSVHDFTNGYVELINTTGGVIELDDYLLGVCDATTSHPVGFGTAFEIPAGGTFLIADLNFAGAAVTPDMRLSFDLAQGGGGVQLINNTTPEEDVRWGLAPGGCANFNPAADDPTDDQSIHRPNWTLGNPTPVGSQD